MARPQPRSPQDRRPAEPLGTAARRASLRLLDAVLRRGEALEAALPGATRAVVNSDFSVTSDFVRAFAAQARTGDVVHIRDPQFPVGAMEEQIAEAVGPGRVDERELTIQRVVRKSGSQEK